MARLHAEKCEQGAADILLPTLPTSRPGEVEAVGRRLKVWHGTTAMAPAALVNVEARQQGLELARVVYDHLRECPRIQLGER